jgi:hypothetical protein
MLSEELDIDYDEINLEIEAETASEESSNEMSESESEREISVVAWEDVTVGDDACGEMMPLNKAIGPSKRQENTWGDKTCRETSSETICVR